MENNKNIDYILDAVIERGLNDNSADCNDFIELLQKKDFKSLIALELYEIYFWDERHEFDLQLLNELVDSISKFFQNPDTIIQIQTGLLQTLPSAIILGIVAYIGKKIKKAFSKNKANDSESSSSWSRIEKNTAKIDKEFKNHDYILSDEIERIFDTSREEIQPLLKLCGCKCYIDKKRSIWLKAGLSDEKVNGILKKHNFKKRK